MNISLFPSDSSASFISATNPFDGVDVGTAANIPPAKSNPTSDGFLASRILNKYKEKHEGFAKEF